MKRILCALATVFLLAVECLAADSARLIELKEADQADRLRTGAPIDWTAVRPRDAQRRTEVLALLKSGAIRTGLDYSNAALIFQHGDSEDDIRIAFSMATLALQMDPGSELAKFLTAASWDRILMREGKPQWYATQYRRTDSGALELYPVDETAVTDAQRRALGLPSLEEARAKAAK
jgi:hypothetical protein